MQKLFSQSETTVTSEIRNFPITLVRSGKTVSSMTKGEIAELTDLAFAAGAVE